MAVALDYWVSKVLADGPMTGQTARFYRLVLWLCILGSTSIAILGTVPDAFGGFESFVRLGELGALVLMSVDYLLRLRLASIERAEDDTALRSVMDYATSAYGIFDFLAVVPFLVSEVFGLPRDAETVFGILRFLKLARFSPALETLGAVILNELRPLAAALFIVVLLAIAAATILYFVERNDNPALASVPAALWWAVVTLTTVGYGDVVPMTPLGKLAGAGVAVVGLCMFALPASILASGFSEEMRRRDFVSNWQLVAKVPFFTKLSANQIAEIAALLKPHRTIRGEMVMREGDMGECMYFIVSGQVEGKAGPATFVLKGGDFFGEIALIERCPRTASIKSLGRCMFLILDVNDFNKFVLAYPHLLDEIKETARQRKAQVAESRRLAALEAPS